MTWARCCRREMRDSVVMIVLMVMKSYRFVGSIYQQWRCPAGSSEVGVRKNWSAMDSGFVASGAERMASLVAPRCRNSSKVLGWRARESPVLSPIYKGVAGWFKLLPVVDL